MAFQYKPGEFEEITRLYQSGQSLEHIQGLFPDKSLASIRMKLVKAGIYKKVTTTSPAPSAAPAAKVPKLELAPKPTSKQGILAGFKTAQAAVGIATW